MMLARCSIRRQNKTEAINKISLLQHEEKWGWLYFIIFESQGQLKAWNMAGF